MNNMIRDIVFKAGPVARISAYRCCVEEYACLLE